MHRVYTDLDRVGCGISVAASAFLVLCFVVGVSVCGVPKARGVPMLWLGGRPRDDPCVRLGVGRRALDRLA